MYYAFQEEELKSLLQSLSFTKIKIHRTAKNFVFIAEKPQRFLLHQIPFDAITFDTALQKMKESITQQKSIVLSTPNPEIVLASRHHHKLRFLFEKSGLISGRWCWYFMGQ